MVCIPLAGLGFSRSGSCQRTDLLGVGEALDVAHFRGKVGGIDDGDSWDGQEIDSRGLDEEFGPQSFLFFDVSSKHLQDLQVCLEL